MLDGYIHPDYAEVGAELRRQIARYSPGGAAVCLYHRGRSVVDVWGGSRDREGSPWLEGTTAPSFSTTKGVVATLVHVLVDQGRADYDDPVARHWPAFGSHGKERITIRQLLAHEAGLYRLGDVVSSPRELLDWEHMKHRMEAMTPAHPPGSRPGYHGLTFGWLAGGLIEAISERSLQSVLSETLATPLALDGLYIGMPAGELWRRARLTHNRRVLAPRPNPEGRPRRLVDGLKQLGVHVDEFESALAPFRESLDWDAESTVQATIPAANGQFTARALARLYAMLAGGGEVDGVRVLSRTTCGRLAQVQNRRRDVVLALPMHWRLGYHRVYALGRRTPHAFGHFGFGGSGALCDPSRELALALTLNSRVGTVWGNTRIAQMARVAVGVVDRLR